MTPHPGKGYRWVKVGEQVCRVLIMFCFGFCAVLYLLVLFLALCLREWETVDRFFSLAFLSALAYDAIKAGYSPFRRRRTTHEKKGMM